MHKTIVLIAATLALASVGFADTVTMLILAATAAFSFGEVKVECKDPAEGDDEVVIGLYDDGRVVDVKTDKRTFVMNASGKDSFVMRRDGKLSEVVCKSGDWIEIPPDSVCPRAAATAPAGVERRMFTNRKCQKWQNNF